MASAPPRVGAGPRALSARPRRRRRLRPLAAGEEPPARPAPRQVCPSGAPARCSGRLETWPVTSEEPGRILHPPQTPNSRANSSQLGLSALGKFILIPLNRFRKLTPWAWDSGSSQTQLDPCRGGCGGAGAGGRGGRGGALQTRARKPVQCQDKAGANCSLLNQAASSEQS